MMNLDVLAGSRIVVERKHGLATIAEAEQAVLVRRLVLLKLLHRRGRSRSTASSCAAADASRALIAWSPSRCPSEAGFRLVLCRQDHLLTLVPSLDHAHALLVATEVEDRGSRLECRLVAFEEAELAARLPVDSADIASRLAAPRGPASRICTRLGVEPSMARLPRIKRLWVEQPVNPLGKPSRRLTLEIGV